MEKKVQITYLLSQAGRKASVLAGGDGKETQTVEADVTPELLDLAHVNREGKIILDLTGKIVVDIEIGSGYVRPGLREIKGRTVDNVYDGQYRFDAPQTAEQLVAWERNRRAHLAAKEADLQPELEKRIAEFDAAQEKREATRAAEKALIEEANRDHKAKLAAEKAQREQEKADWITAHGSDYLKRATALDYNCQRQYVTERAEQEIPGYLLDFDEDAVWKDRSCPSEEALADAEALIGAGHDAKVVWLTRMPMRALYGDEDYSFDDEPDPREAIVVSGYLGKYTLVHMY